MKTMMDEIATATVGDGKSPNLYFVSKGNEVLTITRSFAVALQQWRALPKDVETCLEDRRFGVIASNEPDEDGSTRLVKIDDSETFKRMYPSLAKG
jgi:hypothetical protein